MHTLFLIIATAITVIAVVPYLRDILKGTTKPNIVSWITWSLITGIATIAEFSGHQYITAIFTGAAFLETSAVVVLGLKHGYAKYSLFDGICQIGALSGFLLWWLFNSPTAAVIASVSIDFLASLPTVRHSWIKPKEETWLTYGMSSLGGIFAILALTQYNWLSLTYAVYIVIANLVIVSVILLRGKKLI